jgi:biopolymer transport protein TolQ
LDPNRTVDAANLAAPAGDLSLITLFLQADIVVKLVMLLLLLASIWVWAIVFEKVTALRRVNRAASGFEDRFWSGGSLEDLYDQEGVRPSHPMAAVFGAAMGEWRRSSRVVGADMARGSVRDRIDRAMNVTVTREMERLERWMVFLASVGSIGPFVGLFGTVWGIMHSFSAIAQHELVGGGAGHCGGVVRHRHRPGRRDPGGAGLQPDQHRAVAVCVAPGRFRRGVRRHPQPPERGAALMYDAPAIPLPTLAGSSPAKVMMSGVNGAPL